MIVLGNPEFAIGMKLVGIKNSFLIRSREEALEVIKKIDKEEFILANVSVINLVPEIAEFKNIVSSPDNADEFRSTKDLNEIIKSAVGIELNI